MAGALMALAAGGTGGGGGGDGDVPSPTPSWNDVYATNSGATNYQTISGITVPLTITATDTGGSLLYYSLNGQYNVYTGGFTVHAGDVLNWIPQNTPAERASMTRLTGTVTITNVTDSNTVLDTFSYSLTPQ